MADGLIGFTQKGFPRRYKASLIVPAYYAQTTQGAIQQPQFPLKAAKDLLTGSFV
jgi:hypothetical protein